MPNIDQWRTGRLLSTAARLVQKAWNERISAMGVTHAGVIALGVLDSQGSLPQSRIAQLVRVQAQTMGKTVVRLEAHGHVTRARGDADRRRQLVTITEQGRDVLREARAVEAELVSGGMLVLEEFRSQLKMVIKELDTAPAGARTWQEVESTDGLDGSGAGGAGGAGYGGQPRDGLGGSGLDDGELDRDELEHVRLTLA